MSAGELLVILLLLATFVEWTTERIFGSQVSLKGWPMVLISAGMGLGICLAAKIGALGVTGIVINPWVDYAMTGIIIGGGSNAVHAFFGQYLPTRK